MQYCSGMCHFVACVLCALHINHDDVILLMNSTKKSVILARLSEKLPDDGHMRPKHVGATV
jgi:hypothetical protein